MTEKRNAYGFPVIDLRLERARRIAEAAKKRIAESCDCAKCRMEELAPGIEQLLKNWSKPCPPSQ